MTYPSSMFIRRSLTLKSPDGTRYYSYRLCQSNRIGDKVKQRTLHNYSVPQILDSSLR